MPEEKEYNKPVFKLATKDSFFEIYDNLSLEKPKMSIVITKYENRKVTNKVSFYLDISTFFGLCDTILCGEIQTFIPWDDEADKTKFKGFPAIHYGIPMTGEKMRQWIMAHSRRTGNYQIAIQERERRDKWDSTAPILGQAAFYISHFDLICMASTCKNYLQRQLIVNQIQSGTHEQYIPSAKLGVE